MIDNSSQRTIKKTANDFAVFLIALDLFSECILLVSMFHLLIFGNDSRRTGTWHQAEMLPRDFPKFGSFVVNPTTKFGGIELEI